MSLKLITIAAGLFSLASAVPVSGPQHGAHSSSKSSETSTSTSTSAPSGAPSGAQLKSGNPFSFPLDNGFPNLSPAALAVVNNLAQGTEPNGPAPTLSADDLTSFQMIAFNEIWEVAFFTDLLYNVTNNVAGFQVSDQAQRQYVIDALTAIQAQEELHADNANAILKANNVAPIEACKYKFPTTTLADALTLAQTFTDVVMGTLQDVQLHLAQNSAAGVVPIIGSVIGQEGEQTGWFRQFNGKIPSSKPFLTRATREFAFSALNQMFIVSGSCPNSNTINLPVFLPLTVVTSPVQAKDQLITYSVATNDTSLPSGASLVLINGQNIPLVETVENVQVANGVATFQANFPFTENVLDGLTIAALTSTAGPFSSAEDVAKVTIAGPGLIEIN